MNERIKKLLSSFYECQIDSYLVTKDVNIRYLTGFPASESWLLVTDKKVFYVTDFRYVLEARRGLKGIAIERYNNSLSEKVFELASSFNIRKIGFDDRHVSLATFKQLKKCCPPRIKLTARNNLVERGREIKTESEVKQIRKALKLNLKAYGYLKKVIKPGMTEKDVSLKLESFVKGQGATFSFDPIIASGPNSCFPHAKVTERRLRNNESVLLDIGMDIDGYKSDLTRIFFLGKIPRIVREVYTLVSIAQRKAINKIRANIPAYEVDREARNYLKNHKLDKFFGHSLGHGVGLEIHEDPRISQKSTSILKKNMVFTVEPAVYLPNKFGIRIEDMVLVTKYGCEVLSVDYDQ